MRAIKDAQFNAFKEIVAKSDHKNLLRQSEYRTNQLPESIREHKSEVEPIQLDKLSLKEIKNRLLNGDERGQKNLEQMRELCQLLPRDELNKWYKKIKKDETIAENHRNKLEQAIKDLDAAEEHATKLINILRAGRGRAVSDRMRVAVGVSPKGSDYPTAINELPDDPHLRGMVWRRAQNSQGHNIWLDLEKKDPSLAKSVIEGLHEDDVRKLSRIPDHRKLIPQEMRKEGLRAFKAFVMQTKHAHIFK
jgi:hypothetical protein